MQLDAKNAFVAALVIIVCAAAYFAFFAQPQANPMQPYVNVTQGEKPPEPPQEVRLPSLSVSINNGAAATNSPTVTLYLSGANVKRCMFSTGEERWGSYEPFVAQKRITFQNESEGNKTVLVRCVSEGGALTVDAQASIVLDVKTPSVYVYHPRLLENDTRLEMEYEAMDARDAMPLCAVIVDGVEIEKRGMGKKEVWEVSFSSGRVIESVNVSCVDWAGNVGYNEAFAPGAQVMWVSIENGSASTPSRSVMLYLYARNASECRYRNEDSDWSVWGNYTRKRGWMLSEGYGNRTVHYGCRRADGSEIGVASDEIRHYSSGASSGGGASGGGSGGGAAQPPSDLRVSINNGAEYANSGNVALVLYASNAKQCSYSSDNSAWTLNAPYTTSRQFALAAGEGRRFVYYTCSNEYGSGGVVSDSIVVDSVPPAAVGGLSASARRESATVYLEWNVVGVGTAAYGGNAIAQETAPVRYEVYRQVAGGAAFAAGENNAIAQGTKIGSTTNRYFSDSTASDGQEYVYSVKPVDGAGNEGGSASARVVANFYTIGVSQSSPVSGGEYQGAVPFIYTVNLGGYGAAADCKVYVDGVVKDSRIVRSSQSLNVPIELEAGQYNGSVGCRLQRSVKAAVNTMQSSFSVESGGDTSASVALPG